jgi:hypothetical protein
MPSDSYFDDFFRDKGYYVNEYTVTSEREFAEKLEKLEQDLGQAKDSGEKSSVSFHNRIKELSNDSRFSSYQKSKDWLERLETSVKKYHEENNVKDPTVRLTRAQAMIQTRTQAGVDFSSAVQTTLSSFLSGSKKGSSNAPGEEFNEKMGMDQGPSKGPKRG